MDILNKTGKVFKGFIEVLFVIMAVYILIATIAIDRNINSPCPNTVLFDNSAYFLVALLMLGGFFYMFYMCPTHRQPGKELSQARFYYVLATLALVVAVLQFFISRWMPLQIEHFNSDFKVTMEGAWELAHGGSLENYNYFKTNPNNLNVTIVLSLVYRLFPDIRATVILGAWLTNLSVVLASLSVYNITKREDIALATAVTGELLVALTWRAFLVYTDNYAMIFIALMIWLYTTGIKPEIKNPLIMLFAVCATYIKITAVVVFVAIVINGLISWLRSDSRKLNIRRMALYAGCAIALFGAMFALQGPIRSSCGFKPGLYPKGWQYMFMVGQGDKRIGLVGGGNNGIRTDYISKYKDLKMVNREMFNRAIKRVKRRGLWGNIVFYAKKFTVAYNDGYFNNVQQETMYKMDRSLLYEIYMKPGKYYQISATVFQILWDAILSVIMLYAFVGLWISLRGHGGKMARNGGGNPADRLNPLEAQQKRSAVDAVLLSKIAIIGVTVYLMMLEGRSKYIYMFLPVYLLAFGTMFDRICRLVSRTLAPLCGAKG